MTLWPLHRIIALVIATIFLVTVTLPHGAFTAEAHATEAVASHRLTVEQVRNCSDEDACREPADHMPVHFSCSAMLCAMLLPASESLFLPLSIHNLSFDRRDDILIGSPPPRLDRPPRQG
ncbi:hypothetical protein V5F34_22130 [Xanthobacter autotrophicus]|uniref:Uncharacterized protein n=2 Tax=Xanthobacter TaxID=279 RepID=A7IP69_XANP2|nr:hypothetical protein [Xanthobacter flavus]ABS69815.1 hypothetical protein Xaut_4594 [Xanthobacter autotrophicus Py2]MDR6336354.1 hypothetical protein [Xanthobacter flavus]